MRPLEIAVMVIAGMAALEPLTPFRRGRSRSFTLILPIATVALAILQIIVEGYRWQMAPLYLFVLILSTLTLRSQLISIEPRPPRHRDAVLQVGAVALVLLLALPPILFPVPRLPTPTGPYAVGTATNNFTDTARKEIYGPEPGGSRELMVQIWYPAEPRPGAEPAPWMDRVDVIGPAIASYINLPPFFLDHLSLTRTNSFERAPVSPRQARYPVVVYSHGWNGFRAVAANQMEELASHGYIAVALDHTYGAMVTVFPDNRVALNDPTALPPSTDPNYQPRTETLEATYAADIHFVLDRLALLNQGQPDALLTGRMDLDRVGLYGHSTGGGAVVLACHLDSRCKAGLGMDAWVGPVPASVIPNSPPQPFLFMRSETWSTAQNEARIQELYKGLPNQGYLIKIRGTNHYDFILMPLLSPLAPYLKLKGPLEGNRTMRIVSDYLVAFFDKHLKDDPVPLLDGPSVAYPEVTFEKK